MSKKRPSIESDAFFEAVKRWGPDTPVTWRQLAAVLDLIHPACKGHADAIYYLMTGSERED